MIGFCCRRGSACCSELDPDRRNHYCNLSATSDHGIIMSTKQWQLLRNVQENFPCMGHHISSGTRKKPINRTGNATRRWNSEQVTRALRIMHRPTRGRETDAFTASKRGSRSAQVTEQGQVLRPDHENVLPVSTLLVPATASGMFSYQRTDTAAPADSGTSNSSTEGAFPHKLLNIIKQVSQRCASVVDTGRSSHIKFRRVNTQSPMGLVIDKRTTTNHPSYPSSFKLPKWLHKSISRIEPTAVTVCADPNEGRKSKRSCLTNPGSNAASTLISGSRCDDFSAYSRHEEMGSAAAWESDLSVQVRACHIGLASAEHTRFEDNNVRFQTLWHQFIR